MIHNNSEANLNSLVSMRSNYHQQIGKNLMIDFFDLRMQKFAKSIGDSNKNFANQSWHLSRNYAFAIYNA